MDQFINLLVGAVFAITAGDKLKGEPFAGKYFKRAIGYNLVVFMPIGIYLAVYFTDWSWMYFIDPGKSPAWMTIAGMCGYFLCNLIGFTVARAFMVSGNKNGAYAVAAIGAIGLACFVVLPFDRVINVGTYAQYHGGTATPCLQHIPWVISLAAIGLYFFIPIAFLINKNLKESRA